MAARASPVKIGFVSAAESAGMAEPAPELTEDVGGVAREHRVRLREARSAWRRRPCRGSIPRRASHQAAAWRTR